MLGDNDDTIDGAEFDISDGIMVEEILGSK